MAYYDIAGLKVRMDTFGRTLRQAAAYEGVAGEPDITVCIDPHTLSERLAQYTDADVAEYMATGSEFARQLLFHGGLQLHASAVMLDGKAWLFSAPSGTGKSTHTEKWCRLFGATVINDDKPVLRKLDGVWIAFGTPWSGKYDLSTPTQAPVGGIAFLKRGEENRICPFKPAESVPYFLSQCLHHLSVAQMDAQLECLDQLLQEVPVWELTARNEDEAAYLAREVMGGALWKP